MAKFTAGLLLAALLAPFTAAFTPSKPAVVSSSLQASAITDGDHGIDRRSAIAGTLGASLALTFPFNLQASAAATTRKVPSWKLKNGVAFPTLALNTVGLSADEAELAVEYAVAEGITHVDFHPGKERDGVAQYLKKHPNSNLFLNTKIRKAPPGTSAKDAAERARAQIDEDFKALGVDSVDMLMLRDSPDCDVMQAQWAVLEDALASGKCKSLGIINYCQGSMSCLLETAKVKPDIHYYM